ncbi:MAG: 3-isopropylmalate dehydratase large subunit [Nitrososphaeria archaeon]
MKSLSTIVEKILAKKSGKNSTTAGDFVVADIDVVFAHDGTALLAIESMQELGINKVFDPNKVVFFIDHAAPSPSPQISNIHLAMRKFAKQQGIKLFDVGSGICHQVLPEEGYVKPGSVIVGADSHSVTHGAFNAFAIGVGSTDAALAMATGKLWFKVPETVKVIVDGELRKYVMAKDLILNVLSIIKADGLTYEAVEYHGSCIKNMGVDGRMTIANMAVEMGAKASPMELNEPTELWLKQRIDVIEPVKADKDAKYYDEFFIDASKLEPLVAVPPNVDNVKPVREVEGLEVDQVFIGSCTNGRIEDILTAVKILEGKKVRVRCVVIPASRRIYMDAIKKGYVEKLVRAGCTVGPPTCGPCIGAHMGLLGEGEVAISTSNRNFTGRMGASSSKIFLASAATAAATALEGKLVDPRKYGEKL